MEYVLYDGFAIGIEREEKPTETILHLQGPHKTWDFHVHTNDFHAWGYVKNIQGTEKQKPGETTALVAVGMDQLQSESNRRGRPIRYMLDIEGLVPWYMARGKAVVQPNRGGFEHPLRVTRTRLFMPQLHPPITS